MYECEQGSSGFPLVDDATVGSGVAGHSHFQALRETVKPSSPSMLCASSDWLDLSYQVGQSKDWSSLNLQTESLTAAMTGDWYRYTIRKPEPYCNYVAAIVDMEEVRPEDGEGSRADKEVKMASIVDVNAYSYLIPLELPSKKFSFKWVESRKPERYSSTAHLSSNARLRIIAERVDFIDNLILSVTIGPPNPTFLKSANKSTWEAKDVADSVLSEYSKTIEETHTNRSHRRILISNFQPYSDSY
nr:PsbP domain-containing protein 5, chloroplastic [Tanacetum cinerariifolium]